MGKMTVRRKLAIATWSAPAEGNIYGKLTVEATQALRFIEHLRDTTGERITLTHLVGKAVGMALKQTPSLNGRIVWGGYREHPTVDIAFLVAIEGGKNLAKAKVDRIDEASIVEICQQLRTQAGKLKRGEDEQFKKSQGPLAILPTWLIRPIVHFSGWLTSALGIGMPALGLERYPFGSAIITSVGMFGLDEGYAPPTPWARVPVYVLLGAVRNEAVVRDGQIVARDMLTITATIDHRFLDGAQGGTLARVVREMMEEPWKMAGMQAAPWDTIDDGVTDYDEDEADQTDAVGPPPPADEAVDDDEDAGDDNTDVGAVLTEGELVDPDGPSTDSPAESADEPNIEDAVEVSESGHTTDEAPADEARAEQPTADEPAVEEPTADEPTIDEAAVDEATSDEAAVDEATSDEPDAEEPTADEPTANEPAADGPAQAHDADDDSATPAPKIAVEPEEGLEEMPTMASPDTPRPSEG